MPAPATANEPGTVAYLDHAATTPMHPDALAIMTRHLGRSGTPASLHSSGLHARRVDEEARARTCSIGTRGLVRIRQRVPG